MAGLIVHTVGHSTRSMADFLALLDENGVRGVIDVRSYPRSRRHPQFNGDSLQEGLESAEILYRHAPALGGRRRPQPLPGGSPNGAWREEGFRNFADYALGPDFHAALTDLMAEAAERRLALLCAEALWWKCHRRIIADHLVAAGVTVRHILGPGSTEAAKLAAEARIGPGGILTYPPQQPRLPFDGASDSPP